MSRRAPAYRLASLLGLAWLLGVRPAAAEPTVADRAAAESLFQDGRRLLDQGEVSTACTKFAESHRLAPALGSLLNLAACHEREGKTASAWIEFSEAATLSERAKEHERAAYASERARALGSELATVTITVNARDFSGVVSLDGREIRPGTFGTAIPLDPGEHVVTATSPGRAPFERRFSVGRGKAAVAIEIPALATDPPVPVNVRAATAPSAKPAATVSPSAPQPGKSERSFAPWLVAGGIGVAGLAVGSVYGIKTFSEKRTVDRECPGSGPYCDSSAGLSANERAHDAALVSTLGFGVAAAAGAVLGYLFFSRSGDQTAGAISVTPFCGRDGAHVLGRATF